MKQAPSQFFQSGIWTRSWVNTVHNQIVNNQCFPHNWPGTIEEDIQYYIRWSTFSAHVGSLQPQQPPCFRLSFFVWLIQPLSWVNYEIPLQGTGLCWRILWMSFEVLVSTSDWRHLLRQNLPCPEKTHLQIETATEWKVSHWPIPQPKNTDGSKPS